MIKRLLGLLSLVVLLTAFAPPMQQQSINLTVDAGFDGSFREDNWIPLYVRLTNDGIAVEGRLVVRPETSNDAVTNTYTLPINLPGGSRQAVFMYITAQSFANEIRVELIDRDGVVLAVTPVLVRSIQPRDRLNVLVSQSPSGILDLTGIHDAGFQGFQASWTIDNIPDRVEGLAAVDWLLFNDIDSGNLSTDQQTALRDWVAGGGHLVVTGGANWQRTAAGFNDVLPLVPEGSVTLDNLNAIGQWLRRGDDRLNEATVVATGALQPAADVLLETDEAVPLLARRLYGNGTIDYLTADPNALPLRGWDGLNALWLVLATSVAPQPSWANGIADWTQADQAVNVLPGVNLLPNILPLCGFLALYIGLIGPLNYVILNRLNRREWAWLSIPILIVAFSAFAWTIGFNLRGNDVTLSRLAVVQSWADSDRARVTELVGLLSPRRAQYSLSAAGESFLRPIPRSIQTQSILGSGVQSSTTIEQTDVFRAVDFPVDASFIAGFSASTMIEKPAISGQATLFYDPATGDQKVRGSIQNNTEQTLERPVILARGQALMLEDTLAPGAVEPFEMTLPGQSLPSPSPLSYTGSIFRSSFSRSFSYYGGTTQTIADILGTALDGQPFPFQAQSDSAVDQEAYRRRIFLESFIQDTYGLLTGRGNQVYLAAWATTAPLDVTLEGGLSRSIDTTLYLTELALTLTPPPGEVRIASDQFTWTVESRTALNEVVPIGLSFSPGDEAVFRFTPVPGAVLATVRELTVFADRQQNSNRNTVLQLWNWNTEAWEDIRLNTSQLQITNPGRFLGPANAVQIRVAADVGGYIQLSDLSIEQRGRFAAS